MSELRRSGRLNKAVPSAGLGKISAHSTPARRRRRTMSEPPANQPRTDSDLSESDEDLERTMMPRLVPAAAFNSTSDPPPVDDAVQVDDAVIIGDTVPADYATQAGVAVPISDTLAPQPRPNALIYATEAQPLPTHSNNTSMPNTAQSAAAPPVDSLELVDRLSDIVVINQRIRSLQRRTDRYREANEALRIAKEIFEREKRLFEEASDRASQGSLSSSRPSTDFAGFSNQQSPQSTSAALVTTANGPPSSSTSHTDASMLTAPTATVNLITQPVMSTGISGAPQGSQQPPMLSQAASHAEAMSPGAAHATSSYVHASSYGQCSQTQDTHAMHYAHGSWTTAPYPGAMMMQYAPAASTYGHLVPFYGNPTANLSSYSQHASRQITPAIQYAPPVPALTTMPQHTAAPQLVRYPAQSGAQFPHTQSYVAPAQMPFSTPRHADGMNVYTNVSQPPTVISYAASTAPAVKQVDHLAGVPAPTHMTEIAVSQVNTNVPSYSGFGSSGLVVGSQATTLSLGAERTYNTNTGTTSIAGTQTPAYPAHYCSTNGQPTVPASSAPASAHTYVPTCVQTHQFAPAGYISAPQVPIMQNPAPAAMYVHQIPLVPATALAPYSESYPVTGRPFRPIVDLPPFSGLPAEWPFFISSYEDTTLQFGYTDLDNMSRLHKALSGEAKRRVQAILIRPHHLKKAMESLAKAFGRPETLIEYQLQEVRKLPLIDANDLDQMMSFSISVDALVTFLDEPTTQHHISNPTLLNELECKLPMSERMKWAAVARTIRPYPSIKDFARWLEDEALLIKSITSYAVAATVTTVTTVSQTRPTETKRTQLTGRHVLLNVARDEQNCAEKRCSFCTEAHEITDCESFKRLTVRERLDELRKHPLCYGCLCNGHLLPSCPQKRQCGQEGCDRWHHPMLHGNEGRTRSAPRHRVNVQQRRQEPRNQPSSSTASSEDNAHHATDTNLRTLGSSSTVLNCQSGRSDQRMYFRVVPVILYGPNRQREVYALLDEGSSVSLIDSSLADDLQLGGVNSELSLQFVSSQTTVQTSRAVHMGISGMQPGAVRFEIDMVRTTKTLSLPMQSIERSTILARNPHLSDIPFTVFENATPKLLIGLDHHHLGVPDQIRAGDQSRGVVAASTKLGWVLYGCDGGALLPNATVLHARLSCVQDEDDRFQQLNELVRRHFTTEEFGVKLPPVTVESDDLMRARELLANTTKRIGNRFETGLLWKQDNVSMPDSYAMALQRLTSIEAKMRKNPEYASQYRAQIRAYLEKGYARKMSPEEAERRSYRTWYLPHFAVQSISKPGKFRLVFDAAATSHGVSLNDMLLTGPDVNVPLTRLLFRFRLGVVGVCADVREMYHQVQVRQTDQDAQRFLWRDGNASLEPDVYVMRVMTFGSACSPASAQHVKNLNALEFAEQYPEAADAIQQSHYVDDFVASFQTSEEATRITAEVIELHQRGGFELRGVVSNDAAVQAHFGGDDERAQAVDLEPTTLSQKILGMKWEINDDTFRFQTQFSKVHPAVVDGTRRPTKREILSVAMSIFDPFGLLADFLLQPKTILQELWRAGVGWDEQVSEAVDVRWQAWRGQVDRTRMVRIPRCYSPSITSTSDLQLHVFADASEEAFAAVAFWRISGVNGTELAFVAGKARCAPLKLLSIPRLELQAAVLATRLMLEIRASHAELSARRIIFWSDSETVLKWLRCSQRRYKPFVAFRVAEIVENAPSSWWRWVPTALNVADDATRTKLPMIFDPESRWLRGPTWLLEDESNWPVQPAPVPDDDAAEEEMRPKFVGAVLQSGVIDVDRFSKYYRLVRAVAWMMRFVQATRTSRDTRIKGELTATEVDAAARMVSRYAQHESFAEEVEALRSGRRIATNSQLLLLNPYLDEEGVMRMHGRTDAANESYISSSAKRPIILPRTHRVTMLLVRHHHQQFAHQLVDATIAAVRAKHWVPQLRTLVKKVQRNCQLCRVRSAVPVRTSQGQLPPDRMTAYVRPFTNTGMDYFGPVWVAVGRRREKRWVALFTCLTVRAVHLEIAADLSTDSCLVCIRNLCHIRGTPSLIRCDNGTNFVGARNELERDGTFFDPEAIQRELSIDGVKWLFNCPGNPEAGGAWERLVQSVKRVLKVTLTEEAPRVETLRALLLEAANLINARPLTHLPADPDEAEPLTPNHFLMGGPNIATAPDSKAAESQCTRKQWKICCNLSRRFWCQFVRDYLPELTRRSRHYPDEPPLQVGDLVVICDGQQQHGRWTRGRISEVVVARDGEVRTATVQTAQGALRRPATKLARIIVSSTDGSSNGGGNVGDSSSAPCASSSLDALERESC